MSKPAPLRLSQVDDLNRNKWTESIGTGGHFRPESLDDFIGIRIDHEKFDMPDSGTSIPEGRSIYDEVLPGH